MTLTTPPNNLQNGSYTALFDRLNAQALIRSGGVFASADMAVTQAGTPAMSVLVAIGACAVLGSGVGSGAVSIYETYNDAAATVTITNADPTNPRIDLLCVVVRDSFYTGAFDDVRFVVVAGTPAGTPTVPPVPNNATPLAQIAVAAGATSIVNANITDRRLLVWSSLGIPVIPNAAMGFRTQATANSTLTLTVNDAFKQEFTGTTAGQIVQMPVVSTFPATGIGNIISNKSTQTIAVNSSGGNLIFTVPAATDWIFTANALTGTTAASWSNSYVGASAVPASGGMTLLSTTNLASTATVVSSIDQTYEKLYIKIENVGVTVGSPLVIRYNATIPTSATCISASTVIAPSDLGSFTINNNPSTVSLVTVDVHDYASTTVNKTATYTSFTSGVSGGVFGMQAYGFNNAITAITITTAGGTGTFSTGVVKIYGVK